MTRAALDCSSEHCIIERDGPILLVTLNRPEKKNALSPSMLLGLYDAWQALREDDSLMCAVLTGNGNNFCSGMDLKQGRTLEESEAGRAIVERMKAVPDLHWQALLRDKRPAKPILLAVESYAVAGGSEILQGTDIRVASDNAVFGITEVVRGLYPMGGSAVRLRRQIPYCLAAEMLLLGRNISAEEALRFGLINKVVPVGMAFECALAMARQLCRNGPLSIIATMRTLREIEECDSEAVAMPKVDEIGWPVIQSEDAKEGMSAFVERRLANFKGR